MTASNAQWYICKQASGNCLIVNLMVELADLELNQSIESWGPFPSQNEAIAKRVGLIRAGKCIPA
jgi:hypothetical protein